MNILVDTSVWVSHFKKSNEALIVLLGMDVVLGHPLVVCEIACGTPPAPRERTLSDIGLLRPANKVSSTEVMTFIEREKLYGLGCGFIDISLLASTLITSSTKLWTLDKRLAELAKRFDVNYQPHQQ